MRHANVCIYAFFYGKKCLVMKCIHTFKKLGRNEPILYKKVYHICYGTPYSISYSLWVNKNQP